jgi:hypothetical protein
VPYDVWTSPHRHLLNIAVITTELVVKEESAHHAAHIMLRHINFVRNTSITLMSQQVYPGHFNPSSDPLLGLQIMVKRPKIGSLYIPDIFAFLLH